MIILDTNSLVRGIIADQDSDDAARFRELLTEAKKGGISVGVPAPVFAEFLVRTDEATTQMLALFERKQALRVLPFDKRAAHECALLDRAALATGNKRRGVQVAWQKVKIDRQIVAIARTHSAQLLVTNDGGLTTLSNQVGLEVRAFEDLSLPPDALQRPLEFSNGSQEIKPPLTKADK